MFQRIKTFLKEIDGSIWFYIALFSFSLYFLILTFVANPDDFNCEFVKNVRVEFVGFCLDVLLLGLIFSIFMQRYQRKQDIKRWHEEIKDYQGWTVPEAVYRVVGNIKRLNRAGVKKIELTGYYLKKADLSGLDLGENSYFVECDLRKARFDNTILDDVYFGGSTKLQGAVFSGTSLQRASFDEVELEGVVVSERWWFESLKNAGVAQADSLSKIYEIIPAEGGLYKLRRNIS